jgi:voltage-gated potassium channel
MGEYPEKPQSTVAQLYQLFLLAIGVLLLGTIVGKISSVFVTRQLTQRRKMNLKNHIVICNWNHNAKTIIEQLRASGESVEILLATSNLLEGTDPLFLEKHDIHHVQSDPTSHDSLVQLNVKDAKSVILLADKYSENPDDKNVLTALAIKKYEREIAKNVIVIAELVKPERRQNLLDAGADEIVCEQEFTAGIIAQTALFDNMSNVYQRLLSYSDDSNEIYFIKPENPDEYLGKNFFELCQTVSSKTDRTEKPVVLLGVKRGGEVLLNPKTDRFSVFEKDDELIIMAYNKNVSL